MHKHSILRTPHFTNFVKIFFSLILVLLIIKSTFAANTVDTVQNTTRHTVRVGYFPYAGFFDMDKNGNKSGYGYEYLQNMLAFANWDYDYIGYENNISWDTSLQMLADNKIDLVIGLSKTPEREKSFLFSDRPFSAGQTILTIKEGNTRYKAEDYTHWNGLKVGMLTNNIRNDSFANFASEKGFTYTSVYYENSSQRSEALANEEVDAIVSSNFRTLHDEWMLAQFDAIPIYILTRKDDTELIKEVNAALKQIQITQPNLNETLHEKYFTPLTSNQIAFSELELKFITNCKKNNIVFTALVDPDKKPFSYIEEGEYKGILVDLSKEIFNRAGLSIDFVFTDNKTDFLTMQNNSETSILCDLGAQFSTAEKIGYVRTNPYYKTTVATLTQRKSSKDFKTAAVLKEDILALISPKVLENISIKVYPNTETAVKALENGTVDEVFLASDVAREIVFKDEEAKFIYSVLPQTNITIPMGVRNTENYLLTAVLNKAILTISDADMLTFSLPYKVNTATPTLKSLLYFHPQIIIAFATSILIALFLLVFIFYMHRVERAKAKKNIELEKAVSIANKANHTKTELLSRVSHDIRTPLNAICNMTEFAYQDIDNHSKALEDLSHIKTASIFLLSLINDILDISKMESDKVELYPEPYPVAEFLNNIRELAQPLCTEKHQKLIITSEDKNEVPLADHVRVNQIILNLMSNAIKYTPKGGTITYKQELKKNSDNTVSVHFIINDTGIGMRESFIHKMFDDFSQDLENPARRDIGTGTGLGLSIVKRLIDFMGGTIKVHSTLNKGTRIDVDFIFPEATPEQIKKYNTKKAPILSFANKKLHGIVLLVEDNKINAQIAIRLLQEFGLTVQWAENGAIALEKFKQFKPFECAAILMDLRMPVLDGYIATDQIRALNRPDAKSIPIIALTADAIIENDDSKVNTKLSAHIVKPINPKELYATIKRFIKT